MGERVWNERYNKLDNETDFEYGLRLLEIKVDENPQDLDWQDIVDFRELGIHKDSLRKAFNTTEYSGYNILKYFREELVNLGENVIVDNKIKELNNKIKDFEKEKMKYQDQKREYRNYLRADARFEHLKDSIKNEVNKLNTDSPLKLKDDIKINSNREAVLILSDLHIGLEVDNFWNDFNYKIAEERLQKLQDKVIYYCNLNKVKNLRVELLGDLVNGYIHLGTRISNEEDVISQSMKCAELLSNFINNISMNLEQVYIYSATGNHGRCTPNIKDSLEIENFERIIVWFMKTRLSNNKTINFIDNIIDDNIISYSFLNETIFAVHGHLDKGIKVVDDLSKLLKVFPTEIHMGHYHRHSTLEENDIELVVNGSFSGTDEYAKSIRKSNKPSQTLIIYNECGQECIYKIKL